MIVFFFSGIQLPQVQLRWFLWLQHLGCRCSLSILCDFVKGTYNDTGEGLCDFKVLWLLLLLKLTLWAF